MNAKSREAIALVSSITAATLVVICWHSMNRAFPNGDDAEYLWASLSMFRRFVHEGFSSGLHGLYEFRLWKPILHPVLMVPALFLARGRILLAQTIGALYLYSALAAAVYAVSRRFLSRVDSVIATAVLLNLQWMMLPAHAVKSELSYALFFFATWAFLFWSKGLTKAPMALSGAICLGLASCIRPAESALFFGISIPVFLFASAGSFERPKGELWRAAVTSAVCILPFGITLLLYHHIWGDRQSDWLLPLTTFSLALSWLLYAKFLRHGTKTWMQPFILVSVSIVELWFAPHAQSLLGWIGFTSFETGPHQLPHRFGFSPLLSALAESYFGAGSGFLLALAIILFSFGRKRRRAVPFRDLSAV